MQRRCRCGGENMSRAGSRRFDLANGSEHALSAGVSASRYEALSSLAMLRLKVSRFMLREVVTNIGWRRNLLPSRRTCKVYCSGIKLIGLFVFFVGACTSSNQTVSEKLENSVVGHWNFSIDSPEGVETGTFIIAQKEDTGLDVQILQEGEDPLSIQAEFDTETQTLSFSFEDVEYGDMEVALVLKEEEMGGILRVIQLGVDVPVVATRMSQ